MVLIMKQINNIKFYDAKDGEVRVVFPDGREDYFLEKDAKLYYSKLYAAKMVDKLVIDCLKECGLRVDNAHLSSYEQLNQFQTKFKEVLRKNNINLSFQTITTNKLGITIGGNIDGITGSVVTHLWSHAWEDVVFTTSELENYLKENRNIGIYIKDKYFAVKKVSRRWLTDMKLGTTSNYRGIGSCASIVETTRKLKKDKFGNLYLFEATMIWD